MELQWVLLILSLRKDKHLLLVCIYDLSLNTWGFFTYQLNTTVHCKKLSGLINLRPDLGFWCQTRMKQITLDKLDQKTFFSCYTEKWGMAFTPLLLPSSPVPHPPNTIMNYKLYLHGGSKRIFETTMHKNSLKIQKSQTEVFHVETCFP